MHPLATRLSTSNAFVCFVSCISRFAKTMAILEIKVFSWNGLNRIR
jgi:hypothetical protein